MCPRSYLLVNVMFSLLTICLTRNGHHIPHRKRQNYFTSTSWSTLAWYLHAKVSTRYRDIIAHTIFESVRSFLYLSDQLPDACSDRGCNDRSSDHEKRDRCIAHLTGLKFNVSEPLSGPMAAQSPGQGGVCRIRGPTEDVTSSSQSVAKGNGANENSPTRHRDETLCGSRLKAARYAGM